MSSLVGTHGQLGANSCAFLSQASHEPLAGTAPQVTVWICIEQEGAWGSHPLTEPGLGAGAGDVLAALTDREFVMALAIRRVGRHPRGTGARTVMIARSDLTNAWLCTRDVDSDDELATVLSDVDLDAVMHGHVPSGWGRATEPVTLICTNGKRDVCCAIEGRRLIDELSNIADHHYWECSHLGGHRYAPSVLLLPAGLVLGQISATELIHTQTGHPPLERVRGRSCLPAAAQAGEIAADPQIPFGTATEVTMETIDEHRATVQVHGLSGSTSISLVHQDHSVSSPISCEAVPESRSHWLPL
jgi:hypothetical protein